MGTHGTLHPERGRMNFATTQCSSGATQSRPYPARAVKREVSARHYYTEEMRRTPSCPGSFQPRPRATGRRDCRQFPDGNDTANNSPSNRSRNVTAGDATAGRAPALFGAGCKAHGNTDQCRKSEVETLGAPPISKSRLDACSRGMSRKAQEDSGGVGADTRSELHRLGRGGEALQITLPYTPCRSSARPAVTFST